MATPQENAREQVNRNVAAAVDAAFDVLEEIQMRLQKVKVFDPPVTKSGINLSELAQSEDGMEAFSDLVAHVGGNASENADNESDIDGADGEPAVEDNA